MSVDAFFDCDEFDVESFDTDPLIPKDQQSFVVYDLQSIIAKLRLGKAGRQRAPLAPEPALFTPLTLREHPAMSAIIERLWREFSATLDQRVDRIMQRRALRELVLFASVLSLKRGQSAELAVGRSHADYAPGSLYRKWFLRRVFVVRALDWLTANEYLLKVGKPRFKRTGSRRTVYRIGPRLAALLAAAPECVQQAWPQYRIAPAQYVEVLQRKGAVPASQDRTAKLGRGALKAFHAMDDELHAINAVLAKHEIRMSHKYGDDPIPTWMVRSYTARTPIQRSALPQAGARYYGWYTNEKAKDRARITINGDPLVYLDYKSSFVALAYAWCGFNYWTLGLGDPYAPYSVVGDTPHRELLRKVGKGILTVAFGSRGAGGRAGVVLSDSQLTEAVAEEVRDRYRDDPVPEAFLRQEIVVPFARRLLFEHHRRIAKRMFFTDAGLDLQWIEAEIAKRILRALVLGLGIPVLPEHDGFYVPVQHEASLRWAMTALAGTLSIISGGTPSEPAPRDDAKLLAYLLRMAGIERTSENVESYDEIEPQSKAHLREIVAGDARSLLPILVAAGIWRDERVHPDRATLRGRVKRAQLIDS